MADLLERLKTALADRYAIERELGRGGMATVYLAEDLKHGRKVAIKVLHPELAAVLGADRFLREIQIAAQLQHPHILPLHDSGQAEGFLYYVMPYVKGESLREKLSRERELPVPEVARILRDVADALAHAHEGGVVHRDIKPENVMLSGRHALVTDFGVAKAISEATGRQQLTTAGVALGTPAYMAPEQAAADPHTDHRADIYALGVLGYEMLTGDPPFGGSSPQAILSAHVTQAPLPVTQRREMPPALAGLVMRCLKKKPADRWQKAEELVPQLESLATPSGGVTPTDTRPLAAGAKSWKQRWMPVLTAAGALAIGISLWAWAAGHRIAPTATKADTLRVAVMPFENHGRPQDEFFAEGISDAIRGEIQRVPGLLVIGRQTSMKFKGMMKTPKEIGQALNVDYVLTGTVQWDGQTTAASKILVSPELVRVMDETSRWQDSYVAVYQDVFTVQTEIARKAAGAVSGALANKGKTPAASEADQYRPRGDAYTWYLRGLAEFNRYESNNSEFRSAGYFRRAIEADSSFGLAYAHLAIALSVQSNAGLAGKKEAALAVKRALEIIPNLADAQLASAMYQHFYAFDLAAAEASYREAIKLNSNLATAYGWYGFLLAALGRFDEAIPTAERAGLLDPLAEGDDAPFTLYAARRYDDAIARARAALASDSNSTLGYWMAIGLSQIARGDLAAATHSIEQSEKVRPNLTWLRGYVYGLAGKREEARKILRTLPAASRGRSAVFLGLEEKDSALSALEASYDAATLDPNWMNRPFNDPISSHPRFKALLRKMGLEKKE